MVIGKLVFPRETSTPHEFFDFFEKIHTGVLADFDPLDFDPPVKIR